MNYATHLLMADVIYEELSDVIDLDRKSFVYGNVKPDRNPIVLIKPHILSIHFENVLTLSERLKEEDFSREAFSEELGVLCHYLSDFFCLYHAEEERFSHHLHHGIYEIKLHNYHKKNEASLLKNAFSFKAEPLSDLGQAIKDYRKEYFSNEHRQELDLFFAYRICKLACESVAYYRSRGFILGKELYHRQPAYIKGAF